jgi:hypothetical protein
MRRAKHPMPPALRNKITEAKGFYQISENGIAYKMQFDELMKLKDYYRKFMPEEEQKFPSLAGWYKDLDKFSKEKVVREGNVPTNPSDFYPDNFFEDEGN